MNIKKFYNNPIPVVSSVVYGRKLDIKLEKLNFHLILKKYLQQKLEKDNLTWQIFFQQ